MFENYVGISHHLKIFKFTNLLRFYLYIISNLSLIHAIALLNFFFSQHTITALIFINISL